MSATRNGSSGPRPVLGTANLFGAVDDARSSEVLDAAWEAGFRAFDTAPLYGHGRSEAVLGERMSRWPERPFVTSKVGLEAGPPASRAVGLVKAAARRLPAGLADRLRGGGGPPRGSFDPVSVRMSVERTLARLGPVDRLMLHEAHAEDLTDDALSVLVGYRERGDVGAIGVATVNSAAGPVARLAPDLVTVAHVEVGPFAPPSDLPSSVESLVGHGVLGPGGAALRTLTAQLERDDEAGAAWRDISVGTRWSGPGGLAAALVARAAALPLTDVIVATSRPARLPDLRDLVSGTVRMPDDVAAGLDGLIRAVDRTVH